MYGDQNASGGTKADAVATIEAGNVQDANYLRGRVAEVVQYTDNGTTIGHRTYTGYFAFRTADTVEHTGFVTRDAYRVTANDQRDRWVRTGGSIRKTKVVSTVYLPSDPLALPAGLISQVEDQGDESVTTDSRCVQTGYIWNSTPWLLGTAQARSYTGTRREGKECFDARGPSNW